MSPDERKTRALQLLSGWKDKKATLLFSFSAPKFSIRVEVLGFDEESIGFQWLLFAADNNGTFVSTNGHFVVWLKNADLSVSYEPELALTISHGEFEVVLTVIRESAFVS